jgi:hypothetical protein
MVLTQRGADRGGQAADRGRPGFAWQADPVGNNDQTAHDAAS